MKMMTTTTMTTTTMMMINEQQWYKSPLPVSLISHHRDEINNGEEASNTERACQSTQPLWWVLTTVTEGGAAEHIGGDVDEDVQTGVDRSDVVVWGMQ